MGCTLLRDAVSNLEVQENAAGTMWRKEYSDRVRNFNFSLFCVETTFSSKEGRREKVTVCCGSERESGRETVRKREREREREKDKDRGNLVMLNHCYMG